MKPASAAETCQSVLSTVSATVIADDDLLTTLLTTILADGHVLLEDVPGTGKTLTAQSLATALNLDFNRIQFTPDLLPADITGTHVFNQETGEFRFREGPLFANIVLADEINRAPPKTQAALLEAMGEGQVSVGEETRQLPDPFVVMATQNPVEQEGTFELPEAQRDRFMTKTAMGYPDREGELELLARRGNRATSEPAATPVTDLSTVRELLTVPEGVSVHPELRAYIVDLARATREDDRVAVGISPRGIQRLFEISRARAVLAGREYVVPDDITASVHETFEHRLVLTTEASVRDTPKAAVVDDALEAIPVPAMEDL
ncbi:AAA family ATPase [Halonotius terrestris]|uniref:AAA family ATPase n=1 Tax=Halonotius terrestris TaxID=2487750 RepID=A0A8J8P8R1_9EURY|nr:AAA family ATPase [Halonotius terrestris]TQQ80019.1 AAA family ATPase [Halonotius terrestris]